MENGGRFCKGISKTFIATTNRFTRSPPYNKTFSIIADPAFCEANKV